MNTTPTDDSGKRDYSSIGPSARQLLLLKGYTDIPFARQAAELMLQPKKYVAELDKMDFPFKARLMHFESRYRSIDQLLEGIQAKNILELSSGFSFRGLDLVGRKEVHYIDTDLPEIIDIKMKFIEALTPNISAGSRGGDPAGTVPQGKLATIALNALDEQQFYETVQLFPPGELAILTEGLLMYLGIEEKKKLCAIIHRVLKERGGYWIVADIYVRKDIDQQHVMVNDSLRGFYEAHNIEENKFESFEAAERFFKDNGLVIDNVAGGDYSNLGGLQSYLSGASAAQVDIIKNAAQIRATWRLKVAG